VRPSLLPMSTAMTSSVRESTRTELRYHWPFVASQGRRPSLRGGNDDKPAGDELMPDLDPALALDVGELGHKVAALLLERRTPHPCDWVVRRFGIT